MTTITTRAGKGSPLTNTELDNNFTNLNTAKYESGNSVSLGSGTFSGLVTVKNPNYATGALRLSRNLDTAVYGAVAVKQSFGSIHNGAAVYPVDVVGGVDTDGTALYYQVLLDSTDKFKISPSSVVFNESGADTDFRVESDTSSHLLFADAGNNRVGVNISAPEQTFHVNSGNQTVALFEGTGSTGAYIRLRDGDTAEGQYGWVGQDANTLKFFADNSAPLLFLDTSESVFNQNGFNIDFRVESDSNSHAIFVNAGTNKVGVVNSDPQTELDVGGKLRAHNFQKTWNAVISPTAWSRICRHSGGSVPGGSYTLNIKGTRGNVVYNLTAIVTYGHSVSASITVVGGIAYTGWKLRAVVDSYGEGWIELQDTGSLTHYNSNNGQSVNCCATTISESTEIAAITTLTNGSTIPSGYYERSYIDGGTRPGFATQHLSSSTGGVVVNQNGAAGADFRVESDTKAHALSVDGETGNVGIGYNAHSGFNLRVRETSDKESTVLIENTSATANAATALRLDPEGNNFAIISYPDAGTEDNITRFISTAGGSSFKFATGAADRMTIHSNGRVDLNGPDYTYGAADSNYHIKLEENTHHAYISNVNGTMFLGSGGRYYGGNLRSLDTGETSYAAISISNDVGLSVYGSTGHTAGQVDATTALHHRMETTTGSAIFNDTGASTGDFRVESDGNANMLHVDAGANIVNVGTNNSGYNGTFNVASGTNTQVAAFESALGGAGAAATIRMGVSTRANQGLVLGSNGSGATINGGSLAAYMYNTEASVLNLGGNNSFQLELGSSEVVVNESSANTDFRVESDSNINMIYVDASDGNVAIGSPTTNSDWRTTDGVRFKGYGHNTYGYAEFVRTATSDASANIYMCRNNDGRMLSFNRQNGEKGAVQISGTGVTYETTSDRRLKENIEAITDGTDKLMAMNPVTHTWKNAPDAPAVHGFIAQEMREIIPEAVTGDPTGEEMMSMDYGRVTPVLVAALQDAHKKIAELEIRLNDLEGK